MAGAHDIRGRYKLKPDYSDEGFAELGELLHFAWRAVAKRTRKEIETASSEDGSIA